MSTLRKAFTISVMLMTILSMSVVVAPSAQAAASAGDLVKVSGQADVYYLGADMNLYVFPNEKTYFSWYRDFSGVVTISATELNSYGIPVANVVVRPGTKLIKRPVPTAPQVYAVEPGGMIRWIPDEATAIALYGSNWASRVIDIADSFFTNYKLASNDVTSGAYPVGSLIKLPTAGDVYYIDANGEARKIASEAAFLANRFNWDDVITTSASFTLPTAGSDITGAESALTDTAQGGGAGEGIEPGAGTGLTVALSGDTAAASSIPSGAQLVSFVTVNLTASNDGPVRVDDMTFTRTGTGNTSDFSGGYLYSGSTRLTNSKSVNSTTQEITFNAINMSINAGAMKAVTLKMNTVAGSGGNHAFKIQAANDITTNGATVSGSFPVMGNTMSLASTVSVGQIKVKAGANAYDRYVGETDVMLGEFDIQNNNTEDVNIHGITLYQDGTAADNAVTNYALEIEGDIVASGVSMSGKYVNFVFDEAYLLKKSDTVTATIRGDVQTDISKTVTLYVKYVSDVDARGTAYGDTYNVSVDTADATSIVTSTNKANADVTTIKGAKINVSFEGPNATEIKDDTDNVVFANFKITVDQEDVNFDSLPVTITMAAASTTAALDNLELVDTQNNVSYSATDPTGAAAAQDVDFENVLIQAGKTYNFQIRGDVPADVTAGHWYEVSIDLTSATAEYQTSGEDVATTDYSSTSLQGKRMTVALPTVTFAKVPTNNITVVQGANDVTLFKGKIAANGVDSLKMNKAKFNGTFAIGTLTKFSEAFDKLTLYKVNSDGSMTELDSETSLAATSVSFSGFTLDIPKGASNGILVVLAGDVSSNPSTGTVAARFDTVAPVSSFNVKDSENNQLATGQYDMTSAVNGHITTIAGQGTYTMTVDTNLTGLNHAQNALAGTQVLVGRLKLTAQNEDALVKDIYLQNAGTATSSDIAYLRLYKDKAMTQLVGQADMSATNVALFDDIDYTVSQTGSSYLYIAAVLRVVDYSVGPGVDSTASAGDSIAIRLANANHVVQGVDTGEELADAAWTDSRTSTSTIQGATISNITSAYAGGTIGNGQKKIFSFKVTTPSSQNVDFDGDPLAAQVANIIFSVSGVNQASGATTTGVVLSGFKLQRVGGASGKIDAKTGTGSATVVAGDSQFEIDLQQTYSQAGTSTDVEIEPGTTAEYEVYATVSGVGANDSMQVYIDNIDPTTGTNFSYQHNVGHSGTLLGLSARTYPMLTGISSVGDDNPGLN